MPAAPDNAWTEMSRRIFLRRAAMTSIAASTSAAFLAACGSSGKTIASATTAGAPATTAAMVDKTTTTAAAMVDKATVVPAAMAELAGTINFLNFPGWVGKDTYTKFSALHPKVKVNEIPIGGSENSDYLTKIKDRAGDYDLILVDGTTWPTVDAVKGFGEFAGKVPNIANVDASFRKQPFDPTDARWAATDYGRTGIGYRKDIVKEPITSWKDFLAVASKYKGKVAVLDYQRSVMGSILRMLGKPSSTTSEADIAEVVKVLKELKPNLLAISTDVGKQLATGEIVMAFGDAYDVYSASLKEPNIGWVDPSEGQVAYIEGLAVLKGPRDDLSRALERIAPSLQEAAADLGARPWQRLRTVTLPLAAPGIVVAVSLVGILAVGEFTTPAVLGGGKTLLLGNLLASQAAGSNRPLGGAIATTLLAVFLVLGGLAALLYRRFSWVADDAN